MYSGDPNFLASTSPVLTQTVNPATATVVASSVNPSVSGESLSYTAAVTVVSPAAGNPTGTVAFFDGTAIAGCGAQPLVAGTASCNVNYAGVGTHGITTVYSGDANFISSTSPILTQTINQGATTTVVISSVDPSVTGQSVTYTAIVTAVAPASGSPWARRPSWTVPSLSVAASCSRWSVGSRHAAWPTPGSVRMRSPRSTAVIPTSRPRRRNS